MWWAGVGSLEEAAQTFLGNFLSGLDSAWQLYRGNPPRVLPFPPTFSFSPLPSLRAATSSGYPRTPEVTPFSVQKAPKPW